MKLESRCLNLMAVFFCSLGCAEMSAWKVEKSTAQGTWPAGPATAPDDPNDLDSGVITPFSSLNPDKEVWVASYGDDAAAGTMFEPKRTIAAALRIAAPGTAVMVKAGVYRDAVEIAGPGGVSGKPIWLRSADGKGRAEMGALKIVAANAIIVEGFKVNGGVVVEANATKSPTNILLQNNLVNNGAVDGIKVSFALNLYLVANDVSASPRGQGIQLTGCRNVLVADNYIHDLRTSGTMNDGLNLKSDMRDVLIQNNIIERIDGTAMVLEGINVTARANTVTGQRRAVTFRGCESCALERNNLNRNTGDLLSDVGLVIGDSPQYPTNNIKLRSNCVHRADWLYVETGTGGGLINESNASSACL